ncbi:MAG: M15 family metallopeptidase [Candidatus Aenigmatarchaeota archaeon]|nr:MAG: M15 family metallopeptidase [Candidatus Aenigmarchaeota archaeon]
MKSRKGFGIFGLIIIGLVVIGVVLLVHSSPILANALEIGSEARIYMTINDQTSNIVPLLSSEFNDVRVSDMISCLTSTSSSCDVEETYIDTSAREMRSMMLIYTKDGSSRKFGSEIVGDKLQVTIPAPNGEKNRINFVIPISLSDSRELDREKRLLYGDCTRMGDSEYISLHLTKIEFVGEEVYVNKIAEDDFLKVSEEIERDCAGVNYDFWRDGLGGTYACRTNVNFPAVMSMHAFGLAIDINPSANPNCPKDPQCKGQNVLITDIPQCAIDAFKRNNFLWGGEFTTVKDSMHFEWRDPNVYKIKDSVKYSSEEKRGDEIS